MNWFKFFIGFLAFLIILSCKENKPGNLVFGSSENFLFIADNQEGRMAKISLKDYRTKEFSIDEKVDRFKIASDNFALYLGKRDQEEEIMGKTINYKKTGVYFFDQDVSKKSEISRLVEKSLLNQLIYSPSENFAAAFLEFSLEKTDFIEGAQLFDAISVIDLEEKKSEDISLGFLPTNLLFLNKSEKALALSNEEVVLIDLEENKILNRKKLIPDGGTPLQINTALVTEKDSYLILTQSNSKDVMLVSLSKTSESYPLYTYLLSASLFPAILVTLPKSENFVLLDPNSENLNLLLLEEEDKPSESPIITEIALKGKVTGGLASKNGEEVYLFSNTNTLQVLSLKNKFVTLRSRFSGTILSDPELDPEGEFLIFPRLKKGEENILLLYSLKEKKASEIYTESPVKKVLLGNNQFIYLILENSPKIIEIELNTKKIKTILLKDIVEESFLFKVYNKIFFSHTDKNSGTFLELSTGRTKYLDEIFSL